MTEATPALDADGRDRGVARLRAAVMVGMLSLLAFGVLALPTGAAAAPAVVEISPTDRDWGAVPVGSTLFATFVIVERARRVLSIEVTTRVDGGGDDPFGIASTTCGPIIQPLASCTVTVAYTPTSATSDTGRLIVGYDRGAGAVSSILRGSGTDTVAPIEPSPGRLDFGQVPVGETRSRTLEVTNTDDDAVAIIDIGIEGDDAFRVAGDDCPASLGPDLSCDIAVAFGPTARGRATGTLVITTDATPAAYEVDLLGEGVSEADQPPTPSSDIRHLIVSQDARKGRVVDGVARCAGARDATTAFLAIADALDEIGTAADVPSRVVIHVCPGTYRERVVVTAPHGTRVSLVSTRDRGAVIRPPVAPAFDIRAPRTRVIGFDIIANGRSWADHAGRPMVDIRGDDAVVARNRIRVRTGSVEQGLPRTAILVRKRADRTTVRGNVISDVLLAGIRLNAGAGPTTITNNTVVLASVVTRRPSRALVSGVFIGRTAGTATITGNSFRLHRTRRTIPDMPATSGITREEGARVRQSGNRFANLRHRVLRLD